MSRASQSSSAPAVKTPPSIAHSTRPPVQPSGGRRPLVAGVSQDEHAGAVGRLHQPRADTARARKRGLLIDAPGPQRQLGSPRGMVERSEVPRRVADRREHRARNAEDLEQLRIPVGGSELGAGGGRRIGRKIVAEPVAQERVHGPDPQRSFAEDARDRLVALEQPGDLPRREVGVERHPAAVHHLVSAAGGLDALEDLQRALVLPGDDRGQWTAGVGVPRQHGLALVIEAACVDGPRSLCDHLPDRLDDRGEHRLRVLFDPARPGVRKRLLASGLGHGVEVVVVQRGLHRRCALVDAEQQCHAIALNSAVRRHHGSCGSGGSSPISSRGGPSVTPAASAIAATCSEIPSDDVKPVERIAATSIR